MREISHEIKLLCVKFSFVFLNCLCFEDLIYLDSCIRIADAPKETQCSYGFKRILIFSVQYLSFSRSHILRIVFFIILYSSLFPSRKMKLYYSFTLRFKWFRQLYFGNFGAMLLDAFVRIFPQSHCSFNHLLKHRW